MRGYSHFMQLTQAPHTAATVQRRKNMPLLPIKSLSREATSSVAGPSPYALQRLVAARPGVAALSPPSKPVIACVRSQRAACSTSSSQQATGALSRVAARATASTASNLPKVEEGTWTWEGHKIRYCAAGLDQEGETLVLVHGFGGNADHWRKNTPELAAAGYRVYAIDLLGYGFSDKPDPRKAAPNTIYCFPRWGQQLCSFLTEVTGGPGYIICNSVGGLAGLEASIARPDLVKGVQVINISLRGLHVKRTSPLLRPFVAAFQRLLKETELGRGFFASVAKPQTVRNILREAYGRKEAVTDELVQKILAPGLQPGAVDVFLDFISYSGGPLPEELMDKTTVPVSILWGDKDPWENVDMGRQLFAQRKSVVEFVTLPGVGHCPQDEAPELVNPLVDKFVRVSSKTPVLAAAAAAL